MIWKNIWIDFLKHMNKKKFLVLIFIFSCNPPEDIGDGNHSVQATIIFINQTSDSIISEEGCQRNIALNDSLKIEINERLGVKPNINNFPVSIFFCSMMYKDGDILKCENKVEDIENYEDRKEVTPLVFEFTFRFTEERKAAAEPCN